LRSALPMNLKGHYPGYKVWSRAQGDIQRVLAIWQQCLATYGGPYLFGERSMADAMYAPVVTRLHTYDVAVPDAASQAWCARVLAMPEMQEWTAAALLEPEAIDELEMEFWTLLGQGRGARRAYHPASMRWACGLRTVLP
jgi:glutathione S-transferase